VRHLQVLHGDALAVIPTLETDSVDALITDPPYSSGGQFRGDRALVTSKKYQQSDAVALPEFSGDNRDQRSWIMWMSIWLNECRRVVKPGGFGCLFTDWRQLPATTDALQAGGWVWRGIVPWDKVHARPMAGRFRAQAEYIVWGTNGPRPWNNAEPCHDGVFRFPSPSTALREHMTQKPLELMKKIVAIVPPGGTVLDPFLGSGTTAVACAETGRRCVGVEMTEHFAAAAQSRLNDYAPLFGAAS